MAECRKSRVLDADKEPLKILSPIGDYEKCELVPLEEAIKPLQQHIPDVPEMAHIAKRNTSKRSNIITSDESAAIYLYTMENESNNVYTAVNKALRSENRFQLKLWFFYLKLLLTALYKLPSINNTVWRGIRGNVSDRYAEETNIVWWGFSSCTMSISETEQFVGNKGERTLFCIQCISGKMIQEYSSYPTEKEILLMPGTYFKVKAKLNPGADLHIIHLEEVISHNKFITPPFLQVDLAFTNTIPMGPKALENEKKFAQQLIVAEVGDISSNGSNATDQKYILNKYYSECGQELAPLFIKHIRDHGYIPRLLIVGMTGVGKSSLVNLLAGDKEVAEVSDSAIGCTLEFNVHKIANNGLPFEVIDTVGLNEHSRDGGQARRVEALKRLVRFIKNNNRGFNCIIFVVSKGRIYDAFERDYFIFYQCLLRSSVRTILFVNRCEDDEPMSQWYEKNEQVLRKNYSFDRVVCGTTLKGGPAESFLVAKRAGTKLKMWESINICVKNGTTLPIKSEISFIQYVWDGIINKLGWSKFEGSSTLDLEVLKEELNEH